MSEEPSRITVSRDALRADLAEMELRLRLYFDERLNHKADSGALAEYALRLDKLDRGEFTDVHRRALEEFVDDHLRDRADRGWSRRERWFGVISIAGTIAMLLLSIVLAAHGGGL
jgi:hypothetical protein